jgi:hypothetical protein
MPADRAPSGHRRAPHRITMSSEYLPRLLVGVRDEFVALWRLVEHLGEANPPDWYVAGVRATRGWLACAAVPSILGGWQLAWAPVTERSGLAHEELIDAELFA